MAESQLDELHGLAADIEDDRRRLAHALADLAHKLLEHITDQDMRRAVRTSLGLALRLLSVRDAVEETKPWAALVPLDGWRLVVGRAAPAHMVATEPLPEMVLYAVVGAVQGLERDDSVSAGQVVRRALPVDVVVMLEHQFAHEVAMPVDALWATLGASVRQVSRLVRLPEEVR